MCKIRQDKEIQGINIFGQELKLSQFADDTTLFNSNCNSINKVIAVLDNFGNISDLKLNPLKTKALWLGPLRHRQDKPFGFQWPEKPLRVLGTFISYTEKKNEKHNFTLKLQKLKTILDIWNCRSLTLFGRCLIAKSLGISQLIHSVSSLDVPHEYLGAMNSAIFKFIWKNKKDKIKRKVMCLDYGQGEGQSLPQKEQNRRKRKGGKKIQKSKGSIENGDQGSKKTSSGCPGQVNFPFGQVTFSPSLPDGQGPRQTVRRLNF